MMKRAVIFKIVILFIGMFLVSGAPVFSQREHSVARLWNEELLEAIRNDYARPTVHARNLFHTSIVMYDAWSAFENTSETYFLGKTMGNYNCFFSGITLPDNIEVKAAQEEAVSYAAYRLLKHRFAKSPKAGSSLASFDHLMNDLGYDIAFTSTDYSNGSPAALGNYLAKCMIEFGLVDGSNEGDTYKNLYYSPVNDPLAPALPGNPSIADPNRWQPLALEVFIDQSGNPIPGSTPPFLSPEWGNTVPFALSEEDVKVYQRDGNEYRVCYDPGPPPLITEDTGGGTTEEYKWSFMLVSMWSSHLDPTDGVMWDISPASIGNIQKYPQSIYEYKDFFNEIDGGDPSIGRTLNPVTGQPYEKQIVPRGDYTRVLAEFWADGPNSETPPGHWFTILNYVNDHPLFEKRYKGEGPVLDDLEWDVKAYLTLGGAMHDSAISAWGVKGYYDYIRPISAIRYMADQGQSTDQTKDNYSLNGVPLHPGLVEVVELGDPLAGDDNQNVGKIKLYAWRGPDYIEDPDIDDAGVGWILAENWWPYQRPSFVTPPFAGYVSGHSTYSRAAAEVMTMLTGDEYFPGGMGEFVAHKNDFLVFEEGPSMDVTLQWATYRDASDQTSLSRIWGGIHPPADDIPGRHMGAKIGVNAFNYAEKYFTKQISPEVKDRPYDLYPNPVDQGNILNIIVYNTENEVEVELVNLQGIVFRNQHVSLNTLGRIQMDTSGLHAGLYLLKIKSMEWQETRIIDVL